METPARFALRRNMFGEKEREIARFGSLVASVSRYDAGVEAIRLANARGEAVVLPFLGQMIWSATFDGVALSMQSMFAEPRPVQTIVETYGCLAYHSGLLRNGVPGPEDNHPLHGEAPCAPMDSAAVVCGADARGRYMAITGAREYAMGFGAHYLSQPSVTLREDATALDMAMQVTNLSAAPMDLMYMCHVNFAFAEGARLVQPVPFTPEHIVARTAVPGHVRPTEGWRAALADVAANPKRMERLSEPKLYDPEFVFYLKGARPQADGRVHYAMLRPEGDAFAIAWNPETMPHTLRWVMVNSDQSVAAFAMPATCEPEGYSAEKRKGHVRTLSGGASASFTTEIAYVPRDLAAEAVAEIEKGVA
jgi:hypothetical protein